jgi:hypothetical protein
MLRGAEAADHWRELAALGLFIVVSFTAAVTRVRKRLD